MHNPILPLTQSAKYSIVSVIILFIIYNSTISPTIYWRDAPEFIDSAYTLGIAHPAGFPAYSLISKIFTFFPLSDIAMRVNYVSLFFAILTVWLTFTIIINLIEICFQGKPNNYKPLSAALGSLILGVAFSFWWVAVVTEVYTMNCFSLSAFFLLAIHWHRSCDPKYLLLGSFIFGVSTAVYGANLLFLPAIVVFYYLTKNEKPLLYLILAIAFFLLGYSIHLYLPVRSVTNPTFDWGNPETIKQFIIHITDQKDSAERFQGAATLFLILKNMGIFFKILISEITLIGFMLAIAGSICHFKKEKKTFCLLALIGFINTSFFMSSLSPIAKNGSFFLISIIILVYWIGLGIYFLIAKSSGHIMGFKYNNLVVPIIISFIVFSFVKDYSVNNKSSYYLPINHFKRVYYSTEQNPLIFTIHYWFAFRYFKDVENLRPDTFIIPIADILRPGHFNKVTHERFPQLKFPRIESTRENQYQYFQSLISKNINDRPVYSELKGTLTPYNYKYLTPENNFLMRFTGSKVDKIPVETLDKFFVNLKNFVARDLNDDNFFLDHAMGVSSLYSTFLTRFAGYLMERKMYREALPFVELASSIFKGNEEMILNIKGYCYLHLGDLKQAEKIFNRLYRRDENDYGYNYNLALLYFEKNELKKSRIYLDKSLLLNEYYFKSHYLSGLIYKKEKKYDKSIKEIKYAIEHADFRPFKREMEEDLEKVEQLNISNENLPDSVN